MTEIVVIARILAAHDQVEHVVAAVERLATASRGEAGCMRFDVYLSAVSGRDILIFEIWRSAADLTVHGQTPHMAVFKSAISGCADVEVDKLHQIRRR